MAGGAFKYRPFTFNRSFDEAEIERTRQAALKEQEEREEAERLAELERNPPPPTFSEEELAAAKAAAFQEGSHQGQQETLNGIEAQTLAAMQTITGQLAVLHDRQALSNEVISAQLASITGDIVDRLLPHFVKMHGSDEIIALVKECLEPLEDAGRVIIRVSEDAKDALEEKLLQAAQESGFEGRLVIKGEVGLGLSDVKVDWGSGGTERKLQETWGAIQEAIQHCLAHTNSLQQEFDAAGAEAAVTTAEPIDTAPAAEYAPAEGDDIQAQPDDPEQARLSMETARETGSETDTAEAATESSTTATVPQTADEVPLATDTDQAANAPIREEEQ